MKPAHEACHDSLTHEPVHVNLVLIKRLENLRWTSLCITLGIAPNNLGSRALDADCTSAAIEIRAASRPSKFQQHDVYEDHFVANEVIHRIGQPP